MKTLAMRFNFDVGSGSLRGLRKARRGLRQQKGRQLGEIGKIEDPGRRKDILDETELEYKKAETELTDVEKIQRGDLKIKHEETYYPMDPPPQRPRYRANRPQRRNPVRRSGVRRTRRSGVRSSAVRIRGWN